MDRKILITDDSPTIRKIIRRSLLDKLKNITVFEAQNGIDALRVLAREKISVVILDIIMPEKDGIEVLQEIKSKPELQNIPVIICSSRTEIGDVEKALSLGALDYFTKPLDPEEIRVMLPLKVKNALEYHEQRMELLRFHDRIKEEMQLAEELQKSMTTAYSSHRGIETWSRYIPCEEIGGDICLCKPSDGKNWFMIADVSGHGIAAAMISTLLNVLFTGAIQRLDAPGAVLEQLNKILSDIFRDSQYGLVSAFVGYLDGDSLFYANAGHPYPFIDRKSTGQIEELQTNGFLLGMTGHTRYETIQCEFKVDDRLFLYTDGLFDQGNEGGFADWRSVREYYQSRRADFDSGMDAALDEMAGFFARRRRGGFIDDAAVMVIQKGRRREADAVNSLGLGQSTHDKTIHP